MQHLQGTQNSRRYRIGAAAYLYAALCTAGVGAVATMARADYPERQITMIVCFPAGGGTDIAARLLNSQLGEALGKPVVIENRGGAGGNIGIAAAARAFGFRDSCGYRYLWDGVSSVASQLSARDSAVCKGVRVGSDQAALVNHETACACLQAIGMRRAYSRKNESQPIRPSTL